MSKPKLLIASLFVAGLTALPAGAQSEQDRNRRQWELRTTRQLSAGQGADASQVKADLVQRLDQETAADGTSITTLTPLSAQVGATGVGTVFLNLDNAEAQTLAGSSATGSGNRRVTRLDETGASGIAGGVFGGTSGGGGESFRIEADLPVGDTGVSGGAVVIEAQQIGVGLTGGASDQNQASGLNLPGGLPGLPDGARVTTYQSEPVSFTTPEGDLVVLRAEGFSAVDAGTGELIAGGSRAVGQTVQANGDLVPFAIQQTAQSTPVDPAGSGAVSNGPGALTALVVTVPGLAELLQSFNASLTPNPTADGKPAPAWLAQAASVVSGIEALAVPTSSDLGNNSGAVAGNTPGTPSADISADRAAGSPSGTNPGGASGSTPGSDSAAGQGSLGSVPFGAIASASGETTDLLISEALALASGGTPASTPDSGTNLGISSEATGGNTGTLPNSDAPRGTSLGQGTPSPSSLATALREAFTGLGQTTGDDPTLAAAGGQPGGESTAGNLPSGTLPGGSPETPQTPERPATAEGPNAPGVTGGGPSAERPSNANAPGQPSPTFAGTTPPSNSADGPSALRLDAPNAGGLPELGPAPFADVGPTPGTGAGSPPAAFDPIASALGFGGPIGGPSDTIGGIPTNDPVFGVSPLGAALAGGEDALPTLDRQVIVTDQGVQRVSVANQATTTTMPMLMAMAPPPLVTPPATTVSGGLTPITIPAGLFTFQVFDDGGVDTEDLISIFASDVNGAVALMANAPSSMMALGNDPTPGDGGPFVPAPTDIGGTTNGANVTLFFLQDGMGTAFDVVDNPAVASNQFSTTLAPGTAQVGFSAIFSGFGPNTAALEITSPVLMGATSQSLDLDRIPPPGGIAAVLDITVVDPVAPPPAP